MALLQLETIDAETPCALQPPRMAFAEAIGDDRNGYSRDRDFEVDHHRDTESTEKPLCPLCLCGELYPFVEAPKPCFARGGKSVGQLGLQRPAIDFRIFFADTIFRTILTHHVHVGVARQRRDLAKALRS